MNLTEELSGLPAILDLRELQSALRVSSRTISRILADPLLRAFKDEDNSWCVARADLMAWLEKQND